MLITARRHHSLEEIAEAREEVLSCKAGLVGRTLFVQARAMSSSKLISMISMVIMKSYEGGV